MPCKYKFLREGAFAPEYAHDTDSGADLKSPDMHIIKAGECKKIPLGFSVEFDLGLDCQIRPRSSLSGKLINAQQGTIDHGYRGEVAVQLWNASQSDYVVHRGDKIAQMVFGNLALVDFKQAEKLSESERGEGGFGSTGK